MKARKIIAMGTAVFVAASLSACGGQAADNKESSDGTAEGSEGKASVVHVMNAPLGDQSFFDDAARGMKELSGQGYTVENVQAEAENPSQWRSNLDAASAADWDLIIVGSAQMVDILDETAPKNPEQKYLIYDSEVIQPNVASVTYMQNEGSFLAGSLAAEVIKNPDLFPLAEGATKVGVVGGTDIPIINDFIAGYKKGVELVDPSLEVLVSYVGDFTDANRGYDQAMAMYDQGAGVVFQVAGGAGVGVLQASKEANRYSIGVDSNQNGIEPGHVLASMLKNIDSSIVSAVTAFSDGTLKFGEVTRYGLANGGVGLTFEDNNDIVPKEIQEKIDEYGQKVADGEIEVPTTL